MKCPHCGGEIDAWFVRHATIDTYKLDGTPIKEPVTVAIQKIEPKTELTQAEIEARNLD